MLKTTAPIRGARSSRWIESESALIALSWSLVFMLPSSAAIPDPARPATSRAVKIGASSRRIETQTMSARVSEAPNRARAVETWTAMTMPVKNAASATIGTLFTPS